MLDPVPGWLPVNNRLARLAQAPKHQLADPALAARLLGACREALIEGRDPATLSAVPRRHGTLLGAFFFESLIALSLRVYAQHSEASVSHLRTSDAKHEVDFIIERDDHRVVAVEVKFSANVTDGDVTHLRSLRERLGGELLDAAVLYTGRTAYRRTDGIAVIPAALLGP